MPEHNETPVKLPPQSIEAEMAALGSVMIEPHAANTLFELLDETCFYKDAHRRIFMAARNLYSHSEPIDLLTLSAELEKSKELDKVGGHYYLTELVERIPSAANIEQYCRIVLNRALLRKLIEISGEIQQDCYEGGEDAYDVIDVAEKKIFSLSERSKRRAFEHLRPILFETMNLIDHYNSRADGVIGVPTGFKDLDRLLSGLQNSELIILAARPSMGKTALALNMARSAASYGVPVGIFSLEMASPQIAMRLLCSEARVDAHLVRIGKLPQDQMSKLMNALGTLEKAPIYIDDSPAMNIMEIRSKARRLKIEYNIGLLVVDYLQLVHGVGRVESRQIEIAQISQSLKALAKELDIPVLALSQLSRAVEARGERKPMLSDLRESGAIEQDADVVMFIYRPSVYGPVEPGQENDAEIIVAKQRNGPTDSVNAYFYKEYLLFAGKESRQPEIQTISPAPY
ncbi:MAG TPA: replicative DNA helicase [bacterium]|jgi:replicative DNA helicase|nr:replicative DNA helicase [bacterium]HOC88907.1 replicative DNA helicase [bacterium]HOZ21785.1 replicative DNA helicase [bacterium]